MRRVGLRALLLAGAGAWLFGAPALAAIGVASSEPPAGTVLDAPPTEILIRFDKPIEPRMTTVTVMDGRGRPVAGVGQLAEGDRGILLRPIALPNGVDRLVVKYDVMGADLRDRGSGLLHYALAAPVSGAPAGGGPGGAVPGRSVGWGIVGMAVPLLGGILLWAVLRAARRNGGGA